MSHSGCWWLNFLVFVLSPAFSSVAGTITTRCREGLCGGCMDFMYSTGSVFVFPIGLACIEGYKLERWLVLLVLVVGSSHSVDVS